MGYTHGTARDDETRTCTHCGETYPNTKEYFNTASGSTGSLAAVCKNCSSEINKKRNAQQKEKNKDLNLFYNWNQECKKCHRELPFNKLYFPSDKTTKYGLRFVCRECNPKYHGFLDPDYVKPPLWTEEEIDRLRQLYPHHSSEELIELFPERSVRAIETCADVHGFAFKTEETKHRIRKLVGKKVSEKTKGVKVMSEESKKKLSASLKEHYKTHDSWWKGKHRSLEQVKQMSARAKGRWAGELNPRHLNPLTGADNGRWKGGINAIRAELRSDTRQWQIDSFVFSKSKCIVTGTDAREVHHTTPFQDIYEEAFAVAGLPIREQVKDYSEEELALLRQTISELHDQYGLGAPLCHLVHKKFHDEYGYMGITPVDFLDFLDNILNHKYDTWFEENKLQINLNTDYYNYLVDLLQSFSPLTEMENNSGDNGS